MAMMAMTTRSSMRVKARLADRWLAGMDGVEEVLMV
jgi:hypothetical protein